MADGPEMVSREQLLAGLGARGASLAVYAMEARAGFLADRARHAVTPALLEEYAEAREKAFLAAIAAGRTVPASVRIQDLERFAPGLAYLLPPEPSQRAAVAARLAAKYPARARDVPRLRAVLGLDEPAVTDALARRHGATPDELWSATLPWAERMRWWRTRVVTLVEDLSPFWTAYALTLTQIVGGGVLALPIALAGIGPIPGLVIVVLLGLINVLTVTAIAEAFTRTGSVRWGGAYFGRVVGQHLGAPAKAVANAALVMIAVVALLAYYVGFSSVLGATTGLPPAAWAAVLFGVTAGLVWRGRLSATVATALLVGAVNVGILLILSLLAFTDLDLGNLTYANVPGLAGEPFDPAVIAVVFGVVLIAFFGHISVANCARVVLIRDGSGRALSRGAAAGMLTAVVLYGVWILAVGGAVEPDRLARETGTALVPLAEAVGPAVLVVGAVFSVLAMGMSAVHLSFGLSLQMRDVMRGAAMAARMSGMLPLMVVFVIAELLMITGNESFTGSLGAAGTLAVPLVAGVVPVLLLIAARRRGDNVPGWTLTALGRRPVLVVVYLVFLLALVLHATVIWTSPVARISAGAVALVVVAVTAQVLRSDALTPLVTVEVRHDRDSGHSQLSVVAAGSPADVTTTTTSRDGGHHTSFGGMTDLPGATTRLSVELTDVPARQIRVVAHQIDVTGVSTPLNATAAVHTAVDDTAGRHHSDADGDEITTDGSVIAELNQPAQVVVEIAAAHAARRRGDSSA